MGEIIGSAIGATNDLITTTQTNLVNQKIARDTNQANKEIHERDIEAAENAASVAYERSQEAATTAYERQVEQWNRENEYNSPFNQMQRYEEAGLNPAVMMAGQSAVASSTPNVQQASASQQQIPSPIPMQPWRIENYQLGQGIANIFNSITESYKNIQDASKSGAETRSLEEKLGVVVRNLEADALGKEISNSFAPFIQQGTIEKNATEVFTLYQQAIKANADGQLSVAEKALKEAQTLTEKWRSKEQQTLAETCAGRIKSQIDLNKSQAAENYASAQSIRELLPSQKELNETHAALNRMDTQYKGSEIAKNVELRRNIIFDTIKTMEDVRKERFTNDQRERLEKWLDAQIVMEAQQQRSDLFNPFKYVGSLLGGGAGAAIKVLGK